MHSLPYAQSFGNPSEKTPLLLAQIHVFRAGKHELMMENLRWRGMAKVRMHVAICYACIYAVAITAHKIGRPDLANSIATFTY